MRVLPRRRAVRRPPRMGNSGHSGDPLLFDAGSEVGDARNAYDLADAFVLHYRDAAGVVAPVFEAPQAFYEDRDDVPAGGRADDSAHGVSASSFSASRT